MAHTFNKMLDSFFKSKTKKNNSHKTNVKPFSVIPQELLIWNGLTIIWKASWTATIVSDFSDASSFSSELSPLFSSSLLSSSGLACLRLALLDFKKSSLCFTSKRTLQKNYNFSLEIIFWLLQIKDNCIRKHWPKLLWVEWVSISPHPSGSLSCFLFTCVLSHKINIVPKD